MSKLFKDKSGVTQRDLQQAANKGGTVMPGTMRSNLPKGVQEDEVKAGGGFGNSRFYRHVRRQVAAGLVRQGMPWELAITATDDLTNAEIDEQCPKDLTAKVGALGDGSFLKWIQDHQEQILKVITTIISIIGMFGGVKPPAQTPKKPE